MLAMAMKASASSTLLPSAASLPARHPGLHGGQCSWQALPCQLPLVVAEGASLTSQSCALGSSTSMHGRHRSLPALPCTVASALSPCSLCTSLASWTINSKLDRNNAAALLQGACRESMKVQTETMQPKWLAGVWPGAEIVTVFLDMFDSLRDDNHRNLADCIKVATGAADAPSHVQPASGGHLPGLPQGRVCLGSTGGVPPQVSTVWHRRLRQEGLSSAANVPLADGGRLATSPQTRWCD